MTRRLKTIACAALCLSALFALAHAVLDEDRQPAGLANHRPLDREPPEATPFPHSF